MDWMTEAARRLPDVRVTALERIDSTNEYVKALLRNGEPTGFAVLAREQTAGHGRMGRAFHSPRGGLYITCALPFADAARLTARAAVAVCRAIEGETDKRPQIKWVNDLILGGGKICGILAESVTAPNGARGVALGVGLNYALDDVPEALRGVAAGLFDREEARRGAPSRAALAARVVRELLDTDAPFLSEYRARCLTIGRRVRYQQGGAWHEARAVDVDEACGLVVEENGTLCVLRAGEVTMHEG